MFSFPTKMQLADVFTLKTYFRVDMKRGSRSSPVFEPSTINDSK